MHSDFVEITMDVHQVVPPPHVSTLQLIKIKLKETFFPDDPLRQFKGKTLNTKLILGAQYFFPILQWLPNYSFKLFKSDLVAGLTIASLAIPQGISYAKLATLPPIIGLCKYVNWFYLIVIISSKMIMWVKIYSNYSFFFVCMNDRFEFCSAVSLCCSWKLERSCGRTCFDCVSCDGVHDCRGSVPYNTIWSLYSVSFYFNVFCWYFSSCSWNSKVINWVIGHSIYNSICTCIYHCLILSDWITG